MNTFLTATASYKPRSEFTGTFISGRVTPAVSASVEAAAQLIVNEAQAICPVDTGALRDSISAGGPVESNVSSVVKITAGAPYAGYLEFGTGIRGSESPDRGPYPYSPTWPGMAPRPFLRPALDTTRDAVRELFASQLAIALKK
jgi:HK97 gp10 family phage protein